jgi:hypothetical protein
MKKQISMESTNAIISEIEKNHNCIIVKNISPEKPPEKTKDPVGGATVVAGGGTAARVSGTSTMTLPYNNSMSFVNDKEVKMTSGHRITIVVGDLAHRQVYLGVGDKVVSKCAFDSCNMQLSDYFFTSVTTLTHAVILNQ